MQVSEFDDRRICHSDDCPSYFVEQWSWQVADGGRTHSLVCATYTLTDCDVNEALAWARENQSDPGCFVLHAAVWTNHGFLATFWLTGRPPAQGSSAA